MQAIREKRGNDVSLYAMGQRMINRTQAQLAFQRLERCFDLRQLYIALPQHGRILFHQIGAQQILSILQLGCFQFGLVYLETKTGTRDRFAFARHLRLDETSRTPGFFPRGSDTQP